MEYYGGVDARSLPFCDQSFQWVTSQFGIEYAGFEQALVEAARVCGRGMKMLVHAAEGVVVRQNVMQADQADWILNDLHLPDRLAEHFSDPSLKSASAIDQRLGAIRKRGETDENVTLLESVYSAALASQKHWEMKGQRAAREAVAELAAQLARHRDRMRLLGGAGIERPRIEAAMADLRARGFEELRVEEERFGADNHLVGYWLEANRTTKEGE
jgi:ubiquinone/menaquinone biosynthesis C-methylase UbiE